MPADSNTVFFAWAADWPRKAQRDIIHHAAEQALGAIAAESAVEDAPRLDHDTKGVAGEPAIFETICNKIDACAIFLADVTSVTPPGAPRPMPNANVAIEYGRATVRPGSARIVKVFNRAHGDPIDDLPFDMRHKRGPIVFDCPAGASKAARQAATEQLAKELQPAFAAILNAAPAHSAPFDAALAESRLAIQARRADIGPLIEQILRRIGDEGARLVANDRDFDVHGNPSWDEAVLDALAKTLPLATGFSTLARWVAELDSSAAAEALREGLERLPDPDAHEVPRQCFWTALRHELFLTVVGAMTIHRRWALFGTFLRHFVPDRTGAQRAWVEFSSNPYELDDHRNSRRTAGEERPFSHVRRVHIKRHGADRATALLSYDELADADLLLAFLTGYRDPVGKLDRSKWIPWFTLTVESGRVPDWMARLADMATGEAICELVDSLKLITFEHLDPRVRAIDHRGAVRLFLRKNFDASRSVLKSLRPGMFPRCPGEYARDLKDRVFPDPPTIFTRTRPNL